VQGRGRESYRGKREITGGRKEEKGKKRGEGRVGGGAGQLAIFKNTVSNVWHSATLETTNVAHMPR
jgi:hypothetical protein